MGNVLELTRYQPQYPQSRKIWGKKEKRLDFPVWQVMSEEGGNLHTLGCREHLTPASGGHTSTAKLHQCPLAPPQGSTDGTRPVLTAEVLCCPVPEGAQGSSSVHLSAENSAKICMSQT